MSIKSSDQDCWIVLVTASDGIVYPHGVFVGEQTAIDWTNANCSNYKAERKKLVVINDIKSARVNKMEDESRNLLAETLSLARTFVGEANRLDKIFIETCDPRALQGGDNCAEADAYREFGSKFLRLSRELAKAELENDLIFTVPAE